MKYVMFETTEGQKLPFAFPESMTHIFMAVAIQEAIRHCLKQEAQAVSAGFVSLGQDVEVHGESESMGGLKSIPADAARFIVGDSIAFMPDALAAMILEKLRNVT